MRRVLLTSGYNKSRAAIALAELLARAGMEVSAVLIPSLLSWRRAKQYLRQWGQTKAVVRAAGKIVGARQTPNPDALDQLMATNGIEDRSLKGWCRDHRVPLHTVKSLNHDDAVRLVRDYVGPTDWVAYCGGGILRGAFLEAAGGRVLNAHSGPLPEVRGMNASEWSVLLGTRTEATIHLIDKGIDTGDIVRAFPYHVVAGDNIETIRCKGVVSGILGLVEVLSAGDPPKGTRQDESFRQCFILAPGLRDLLVWRLKSQSERTHGAV